MCSCTRALSCGPWCVVPAGMPWHTIVPTDERASLQVLGCCTLVAVAPLCQSLVSSSHFTGMAMDLIFMKIAIPDNCDEGDTKLSCLGFPALVSVRLFYWMTVTSPKVLFMLPTAELASTCRNIQLSNKHQQDAMPKLKRQATKSM